MNISFNKNVNGNIHYIKVEITIRNEKVKIYTDLSENYQYATYINGYFEIMGTIVLSGKSITRIKCPKDKIHQVEEYINS